MYLYNYNLNVPENQRNLHKNSPIPKKLRLKLKSPDGY